MSRAWGRLLCALGWHRWKMTGGTCADGWVWVTDRCERCGAFFNPYMQSGVEEHDRVRGSR
jgi:hypothetical protein